MPKCVMLAMGVGEPIAKVFVVIFNVRVIARSGILMSEFRKPLRTPFVDNGLSIEISIVHKSRPVSLRLCQEVHQTV